MEIRPSIAEDFVKFFGKVPKMTVRSLTGVDEAGEVLAIGGYYLYGGAAIAFTDHRKGISKRDMVKGARELMKMLKETNLNVIATSDDDKAVALKHYGFEQAGKAWRMM
jgi:hypothetical protein